MQRISFIGRSSIDCFLLLYLLAHKWIHRSFIKYYYSESLLSITIIRGLRQLIFARLSLIGVDFGVEHAVDSSVKIGESLGVPLKSIKSSKTSNDFFLVSFPAFFFSRSNFFCFLSAHFSAFKSICFFLHGYSSKMMVCKLSQLCGVAFAAQF